MNAHEVHFIFPFFIFLIFLTFFHLSIFPFFHLSFDCMEWGRDEQTSAEDAFIDV